MPSAPRWTPSSPSSCAARVRSQTSATTREAQRLAEEAIISLKTGLPVRNHPHQEPAREMGRRFPAQIGAPLTAQSIEVASLEIRHHRQNRDIARQRSPRRRRYRALHCMPGFGFRAVHADHATRFVLRLGSRRIVSIASSRWPCWKMARTSISSPFGVYRLTGDWRDSARNWHKARRPGSS